MSKVQKVCTINVEFLENYIHSIIKEFLPSYMVFTHAMFAINWCFYIKLIIIRIYIKV